MLRTAAPRLAALAGALAIATTLAPLAGAEEIRLARHPAVLPDRSAVVFRYAGDLWRVPTAGGDARRLTAHPGWDDLPVVSPDGRLIAFASARDGHDGLDVFVMPTAGGTPRRLTWDTADDWPLAFSPDGAHVLFRSSRGGGFPERSAVYRQRIDGPREPEVVLDADVTAYVPTEYGAIVARGGTRDWRKGYVGSAASDLWLVKPDGEWGRLTGSRARDRWPAFGGNRLFWVSGREGTDNLYADALDHGPSQRLTAFEDDGVRWVSVTPDGLLAVLERGDDLYRLDLAKPGATPERIPISLGGEVPVDPTIRTVASRASDFAASPDGKSIAAIVEGDVVVRRLEDGVSVRVTDSPAREESPVWEKGGRSLLFVSDAGGRDAIYRARAAEGEDPRMHRALRFTTEEVIEDARRPILSPDGERIIYARGLGDIYLAELDDVAGTERRLLTGWDVPFVTFSPDGEWIACSREDDDFNEDVLLLELATGRTINVSQHPDGDRSPAFSPDGRALAFCSRRHGDTWDVYLVYLRREDDERTREDRADEREDEAKEKKSGKGKVEVVVDTDDLFRRIRRVKTLLADQDVVEFTTDSKALVFRSDHEGSRDLYRIDLDGSDLKRLTTGAGPGGFDVHAKTKGVFFLRGGRDPAQVPEKGGKLDTYRVEVRLDRPRAEQQAQVFSEAWRTMRDRWYDGTFKGKDWDAVYARYADLAATRPTHREFHEVCSLMLGELNGSHLGISGGGEPDRAPDPPETGRLGVDLEPGDQGWTVRSVMGEGPCDRADAHLAPGDVILAIDGEPLDAGTVLARRLAGTVDRRVALTVRRAGAEEGASPERVVVRPASARTIRGLAYERWTEGVRALVDQRSNGRLGYVHVQAMDEPSLERFEAELFARAHGKDGLIIDVRFNGGGWTADYLLAILHTPRHAYTIPRGGGRGYPQGRRPLAAWTRPIAVLCNERSFSNAEIFSHAVKTTGRGVLVGRETFGGVISTGATTLSDGSRLRLPFRGWYVLGTNQDMDRKGAVPDIEVDNLPGDPKDRQAEAAVEALLKQLPF